MQPRRSWSDGNEKDDDVGSSDTATTTTTSTSETEGAAAPAEPTMDDYFFQDFVRACRNVVEPTSYLEIFNYSVSQESCREKDGRRWGGGPMLAVPSADRVSTIGSPI